MLFQTLNPEILLKVVIFFLAKFFEELHGKFAIVCLHMCSKEKTRKAITIPMNQIFIFTKVLQQIGKIIDIKIYLPHMKNGLVHFCLYLFPFKLGSCQTTYFSFLTFLSVQVCWKLHT